MSRCNARKSRRKPTKKGTEPLIVGIGKGDKINMDKSIIAKELQEVEKMIGIVTKDIAGAPEGRLRIACRHGNEQYYHVTNDTNNLGDYISKKNNINLAKSLAQKDYAEKYLEYLLMKKEFLENAIRDYEKFDDSSIYAGYNESRRKLIMPYYISDKEYVNQWEAEVYEGLPLEEDVVKIYSERGEVVRSKSEKIIADKLLMLGIPYKYERPLNLNGYGVIYPDFTLLDIKNRREVILEHFGMMDNSEYSEKAIKKIGNYQKSGYVMGEDFLCTFETYRNPIDVIGFEKMLHDRFS